MARPEKSRFICQMPHHSCFRAETPTSTGINLTVEEYEVIRLSDYLGMTQAECAVQMNISRTTVQALYWEARKSWLAFLLKVLIWKSREGITISAPIPALPFIQIIRHASKNNVRQTSQRIHPVQQKNLKTRE